MHASNIVQMGCRRIDFISKFLELLWPNTISMLEGKNPTFIGFHKRKFLSTTSNDTFSTNMQ